MRRSELRELAQAISVYTKSLKMDFATYAPPPSVQPYQHTHVHLIDRLKACSSKHKVSPESALPQICLPLSKPMSKP